MQSKMVKPIDIERVCSELRANQIPYHINKNFVVLENPYFWEITDEGFTVMKQEPNIIRLKDDMQREENMEYYLK